MNGNCHFIFGASIGALSSVALHTDATTTALLVSTCLIGSIFPDIDNPNSNFGQLTKPISTIIGKIQKLEGKKAYQHRGILHSFLLYFIGLIITYIWCPYLLGFFIGALSHIFLDMFNPSGVPLLLFRRIRFARIPSSNEKACLLVTSGFTLFAILCTIYMGYYHVYLDIHIPELIQNLM